MTKLIYEIIRKFLQTRIFQFHKKYFVSIINYTESPSPGSPICRGNIKHGSNGKLFSFLKYLRIVSPRSFKSWVGWVGSPAVRALRFREEKREGYNGMLRTYVLLLKMRAIKSTLWSTQIDWVFKRTCKLVLNIDKLVLFRAEALIYF